MSDARLAAALERCVQAVRTGQSPETALRPYTSLRPELDSLLMTALHLGSGEAAVLPASHRASMRSSLMESVRREPHAPAKATPGLRWPQWRLALAPIVAVVLAVGAFLTFAAVQQTEAPSSVTVLTILGGDVQVETARGLVPGINGMTVNEGDRILTLEGARAVITFFDGSTVVIESGSDVTVSKVDAEDGHLRAVLTQAQGSTWTHIPQALGAADVEIETPNARVETSQASVQTRVDDTGTQVGASDGSVAVESDAARAEVPSGFSTSVGQPGTVTDPQPVVQPVSELVLRVDGPAYALLTEPGQATLGTAAPGVPVNQVPGARVERSDSGAVIYIPNPGEGVYNLNLSASGSGPVSVTASIANGTSNQVATRFDLQPGDSAGVSFSMQSDDLKLLSATKEPVAAAVPPAVVVPQTAVDRASGSTGATPAIKTPTAVPTETKPAATATPTRTATPSPTATPVPPTATPTRGPTKVTPIPSDVQPQDISSSNTYDAGQ